MRKGRSFSAGPSRSLTVKEDGCEVAPLNLNSRWGGRPNRISSTRFTWLTWLPMSLFMQFKRAANIYFLFVSIIVCIPGGPIMWQSTVIPFGCVLLWTALKDLYEDMRRRRDDDAENMATCLRFDFATTSFVKALWRDVVCGDVLLSTSDDRIPADVLMIRASSGTAYISTTNLDGETNLKERRAADLLSGFMDQAGQDVRMSKILADPLVDDPKEPIKSLAIKIAKKIAEQNLHAKLVEPKAALTDMEGELQLLTPSEEVAATLQELKVGQPSPVTYENFVPRGCVLRNTTYMVSLVAYTGVETKTQLNIAATGAKVSNMQLYLNKGVQGLVGVLFTFCLYASLSAELTTDRIWDTWPPKVHSEFLWKNFLYYVVIVYQIVPISLYVCFEIIKLILGAQINMDRQMVDPLTKKAAVARTADLVEEMGQVNFVFSDKTGTLTENEMVFARCCIAGRDMGDFRSNEQVKGAPVGEPTGVAEVKRLFGKDGDKVLRAEVRWFFFCLTTCHTGQVEMDEQGRPFFSGSSPDEVAFLEAAHAIGITYRSRRRVPGTSNWDLIISGPDGEGEHSFRVLCEVPFNSDRKRMTVVCEYKGQFFCICKGADNVMGPLCAEPFDARSTEQLTKYSKLGLRTLAISSKVVEQSFFEDWQQKLKVAQSASEDREKAIDRVAAELEHSMVLAGISAIEDKLQAGVPEAIVTIKAAGIRFWVLTGDKTETAVEIVRASRLFTEDMTLAYMVDCTDEDHALQLLSSTKAFLEGKEGGGLILDGTFVKYAIKGGQHRLLLYQLAMQSRACVCCRLSPQQKRKLVELVKELNKGGITLAVGDGANDVSMIQGAHVGVGIRGKEGNQAVQASDVALSQFRFLVPLLLCHGRRAYRRVSLYLCYYIYKHIVLATGDMVWAHQFRFRGEIAYPEWLSAAFPAILTGLPIIVIAGFDMDLPDEVACQSPELYVEGLERMCFNARIFTGWMLSAVFHGSLAWVLPSWLAADWSTEHTKDSPTAFWVGSTCSFVVVIIYVNLRLWMVSLNPFSRRVLGVMLLSFVGLLVTLFVLGETSLGVAFQPQIEGVPTTIFTEWRYIKVLVISSLPPLLDLIVFEGLFYFKPMPLDLARRKWRSSRKPASQLQEAADKAKEPVPSGNGQGH